VWAHHKPTRHKALFWVFWTGSGPTSLLDMCTASGGGPLGQPCFLSALLPRKSLLQGADRSVWPKTLAGPH